MVSNASQTTRGIFFRGLIHPRGCVEGQWMVSSLKKFTNRGYLDAIEERVLLFDGAMGDQPGSPEPDGRAFWRSGDVWLQ